MKTLYLTKPSLQTTVSLEMINVVMLAFDSDGSMKKKIFQRITIHTLLSAQSRVLTYMARCPPNGIIHNHFEDEDFPK